MPAGGKKSQRAAQVGSKRGAQLCRELPRFSARAPSTYPPTQVQVNPNPQTTNTHLSWWNISYSIST